MQRVDRADYADLPADVRVAVEARTGPVERAVTASAGLNSALAARLTTPTGTVFLKGLRATDKGVVTQQREAVINAAVARSGLAPRLLWHLEEIAGWNLLCFEHVTGRHADYRPGSHDLPAVVEAIEKLGNTPCPDLPLKRAEQRWADHIPEPTEAEHLAGDTLLHTDFNPLNVLIASNGPGRARIIDWAWPTRGAAFIDPACLVLRLIHNGHTPAEAEAWAGRTTAWSLAPRAAVDTFARANTHLWRQIASADPQPWKQAMAKAAHDWAEHRSQSAPVVA